MDAIKCFIFIWNKAEWYKSALVKTMILTQIGNKPLSVYGFVQERHNSIANVFLALTHKSKPMLSEIFNI